MKKTCLILLSMFVGVVMSASPASAQEPKIEEVHIDGLFSNKYELTNQVIPLTSVTLLNFLEPKQSKSVNDLLKAVYPNEKENQLQNKTASMKQCFTYFESLGYKPKWENKPLTANKIKEEIKNKRPVIAYLTSNGNYWPEPQSAVIIYSVTTLEFPGDPVVHATYAARSVNHVGGTYLDSENTTNIPLLQKESIIDPTLSTNYSWTGTVYNITK